MQQSASVEEAEEAIARGPSEDELDRSIREMLDELEDDVVTQLQDSLCQMALEEEDEEPAQPSHSKELGRPHVGPRQFHQRPVFHDVLDGDLLDDDDDDFFGSCTKNKALRRQTYKQPAMKGTKKVDPRSMNRSLSPTPDRRNKVMSLAA